MKIITKVILSGAYPINSCYIISDNSGSDIKQVGCLYSLFVKFTCLAAVAAAETMCPDPCLIIDPSAGALPALAQKSNL